eukprot:4874036-Prymnesium_polylepis.1
MSVSTILAALFTCTLRPRHATAWLGDRGFSAFSIFISGPTAGTPKPRATSCTLMKRGSFPPPTTT